MKKEIRYKSKWIDFTRPYFCDNEKIENVETGCTFLANSHQSYFSNNEAISEHCQKVICVAVMKPLPFIYWDRVQDYQKPELSMRSWQESIAQELILAVVTCKCRPSNKLAILTSS